MNPSNDRWLNRSQRADIVQANVAVMAREMLAWHGDLKEIDLAALIPDMDTARQVVIFSADMINGFCKNGALASERVDAISDPIADLFYRMHGAGVRNFVLLQEWHDEHAKEFESFPPHGIRGTVEADTIPELSKLPFSDTFNVFRKNALTPAFARKQESFSNPEILGVQFEVYLASLDFKTAIIVGNCTDLCVRELAMYIRMWANQCQKDLRVVIPEDCVETFDMDFKTARELGAMPHPGDMYHIWALYEMARNGIDVVKEIV